MKFIGKILFATLILILASVVSGAMVSTLPWKPPVTPWTTTPGMAIAWMALGSLVLVAGMVPIASNLGGGFPIRYLALALLLFVANGVNTVIELTIFSTMGGEVFLLVQFAISLTVTAAALAWLFGAQEPVPSVPRMSLSSWAWRVVAAWLAFPAIYVLFGMCVGPFVIEYYRHGALWWRIPPIDVILRTQLLRSLLFLGASLPVIVLWAGSRRHLILALGMAHAVMVGLHGLSQAYWMPLLPRVLHSLEITADSFAYALVLAWLFCPQSRTAIASRATPASVVSDTAA